MPRRPLLPILTAALLACVGVAQAQTHDDVTRIEQKSQEVKVNNAKTDYVLPKTKLTGEIIYLTLAGDLSLQRGRPDMAYATYMQLALKTRDPRYAELAYKIAAALQNTQAAVDSASLLKELAPNAVVGQAAIRNVKLGQAYELVDKQEYRPAYLAAQAILAQEPDNVGALALLTDVADRLELHKEALAAAERWVKLEPENAEALNSLGYFLANKNIRLNEASVLIQKANQIKPNTPHIMDSLGWLLYRQGNLDAALPILKQAVIMEPNDEGLVHLAEVLWQKGERDLAIKAFKTAYQNNAFSSVLRDTLERLNIPLELIRHVAPTKGAK